MFWSPCSECVGVFDAVSFLRYSVYVKNPVMGQVCVCFDHPAKSVFICMTVCVCLCVRECVCVCVCSGVCDIV